MRPAGDASGARKTAGGGGLSLVEVLVVMGILLLLLGLALKSFGTALGHVRQDVCLWNLRETTRAVLFLAQETPLSESAPDFPGLEGPTLPKAWTVGGSTWADAVLPNLEEQESLLHCPARGGEGPAGRAFGLNLLAGARIEVFSGAVVEGFLLTPGETRPRPLATVRHPGRTVLLAEAGRVTEASSSLPPPEWREESEAAWWPGVVFPIRRAPGVPFGEGYGYAWGPAMPGSGVPEGEWEPRQRAIDRHGTGVVSAAFVDGHAGTEPVAELSEAVWGAPDCLFDNEP